MNLVRNHLENNNSYETINYNPLEETINMINAKLGELLDKKFISSRLYNLLIVKETSKLGKFRVLPKLHKSKFGIRPIINCKSHPTSSLAFLLDIILQPFVKDLDSYIQDSQNLIQKIDKKFYPENSSLFTGDFDSLYTNIDHEDALRVICDYIKDKLNSKHLNIIAFSVILELILNHNIFEWDNNFYRQVIGIAMGSKCGPSIANIYLSVYENKWLLIQRPLLYSRFIDDVFIISNTGIQGLVNAFGNLKLNIVEGNPVIFLDLKIKFDKILCKISFSLYIKPTNTFCFLFFLSNHPSFIFRNIPKSIFIRVRRICTEYSDYLYFSRLFVFELVKRGYDFKVLSSQTRMIGRIKRDDLIPYKEKKTFVNKKNIYLTLNYDKNLKNVNQIAVQSWLKCFQNHPILKEFNLVVLNKMQPNLGSILVHNFPCPKLNSFKYKKSENVNCLVCRFSKDKAEKISLTKKFFLSIVSDSNCESNNCVYILKCSKCEFFYIGQTNLFKRRFMEHINSILKFEPYSNSNNSTVGLHFNLNDHDYTKDLCFFIYKTNLETSDRLKEEAFLIQLFIKMEINILNDVIPPIFSITNSSFFLISCYYEIIFYSI